MTARDAWGQVAHDLRALADSIDAAIEPAPAAVPGREGASATPPPRSSAPAAPNTALSVCPTHRVAWTVKQGGISKAGRPYPPFWRCNEKDADGYCSQRPTKAWADSHPIELDEVPF